MTYIRTRSLQIGARYIPELNIICDHKRWKVVGLRVKTESSIAQSLNPVHRIVLSPAVSLSPALTISALQCHGRAAADSALAKATEAGKVVLRQARRTPHPVIPACGKVWRRVI